MQSVPNKDKNSKYKYTKKIIDSTKTKSSNRTLPMSSDIEHILRHVRKLQAINKMAQGAKYHRDLDLVFGREDGYFICDTTFRAFVNKRLAEAESNIIKYIHFVIFAQQVSLNKKLISRKCQSGSDTVVLELL